MSNDAPFVKSLREEAEELETAGRLEQSLQKWQEIRAAKDSPYAALRHAMLALDLRRWAEAEQAALAGIEIDPQNDQGELAWLLNSVGMTLLNLNEADGRKEHLQRAQTYFRKAIEINETADFCVLLGATYMRAGDNSIAEQIFRRALELNPSHDEAMYNLAEVIRCSRTDPRPDEAVQLYRKSLAIDPNYAEAYRGLAYVFFSAGKFEEAEEQARRALKLNASDWATHTILGRLLRKKTKYKAARRELMLGAELGAHKFDAQAALASFYDNRGTLQEAAEAYRVCLALEPDNAWANRRYGAVLADLGETVRARVFFNRALILNPDDETAKGYLDKLSELYPHRRIRKWRTPRRGRG